MRIRPHIEKKVRTDSFECEVRPRTRCAESSHRAGATQPRCTARPADGTAAHLSLRSSNDNSYEDTLRIAASNFGLASVTARGGVVGAVDPEATWSTPGKGAEAVAASFEWLVQDDERFSKGAGCGPN